MRNISPPNININPNTKENVLVEGPIFVVQAKAFRIQPEMIAVIENSILVFLFNELVYFTYDSSLFNILYEITKNLIMKKHLAQLNISKIIPETMADSIMADFVAQLDTINALAESSKGFVWRLKGDDNNAKIFGHSMMIE